MATLSETGESRVRGYLYIIGRSLRASLPREVAEDALRELESHVRERLDTELPARPEKEAIEGVLAELGSPLQVARAYSTELVIEEAVATGRLWAILRAVWHLGATSVVGFAWALFAFVGWVLGISFMLIAPIKLIFPNNVGIFYLNGQFRGAGAEFGLPPGTEAHPFGYWIVPVTIALGLGVLVGTQRASRHILGWLRARRGASGVRVRVEVGH
jgi:uncharacterized membrane protein